MRNLAIIAFLFAAPMAEAKDEACVLVEAKSKDKAELVVYFTRFEKEDKTKGEYKRCQISKAKVDDAKSFFITPFRQDATVVVHRKNWPE